MRSTFVRYIIVFSSIILLTSCEYLNDLKNSLFGEDKSQKGKAIAKVYDKYLYESDLQDLLTPGVTRQDSQVVVERFVNHWVKQQVLIQKALTDEVVDNQDLQRRVDEYKYQLLIYAFERNYIESNLDTVVTLAQVKEYYDKNPYDFELKKNIVKCYFLKISNEAPNLANLKGWLKSNDSTDLQELKSYAYSYADIYHINDSAWVDFENIIQYTPFMEEITNQIKTLKSRKIISTEDSLFNYHLKILDYKIADEESPIGYVKNKIREIILSKRKVDLKKELEQDILETAKEDNEIELF